MNPLPAVARWRQVVCLTVVARFVATGAGIILGTALASTSVAAASAADAARSQVALTFDDLPNHGGLPPGLTRSDVARTLIAALQQRRVAPSYGFVNAQGLKDGEDQLQVLRLWRAAGYLLGNHAFSHMDLNEHSVDDFENDVLANEPTLREFMAGAVWRWFRFPYLHQGETAEKRQAVAAFLRERGYRIAEVTLNFDDWAYNGPYARCSAEGDAAALEWLKQSYLEQAAAAVEQGRREARDLVGRDIRHVMLLHIGAMTAAMMPRLLDLLERERFDVVELAQAAADPVYATVPEQATRDGLTLLEQLRRARTGDARPTAEPTLPRPFEKLAALCQ
jgi:peptidoglycan/xylan/chitin deacetylase (PgdA/CDA1 family)